MTTRSKPRFAATAPPKEDCGCSCELDLLPKVDELGFDGLDSLMLDLIRCVCSGYASGDIAKWEMAYRLADQRLGGIDGPSFVARAVSLMRAVQMERKVRFGFRSLGCQRISGDEFLLMAVIRAARLGNTEVFNAAIRDLATVAHPERIASAANAIAGLCQRHGLMSVSITEEVPSVLN